MTLEDLHNEYDSTHYIFIVPTHLYIETLEGV